MTQEEKLEEAKRLYKNANADQRYVLKRLFPELEESGDERIIRSLKEIVTAAFSIEQKEVLVSINELKKDDLIAWLEKQSKPIDKEKFLIDARRGVALSIMNFLDTNTLGMCLSGMERADLESAVIDSDWSKVYDYMKMKLEKQGKQTHIDDSTAPEAMDIAVAKCFDEGEPKSADKLEPDFNFKVGQWIVATGKCAYLIVKIDGFNVTLVDTNGDESVFDVSSLDDAHLWSIDDAQDGDVLATESTVFIFKHIDKAGLSICKSYCEVIGNSKLGLGFDFSINCVCPATKKRRDILEKAMADAGFTFDFEKKELKKIEQLKTWSKSIKNGVRTQSNQEWSEEDERNLQGIIDEIEANKHSAPDYDLATYDRFLSWLKSLRPRNIWKPSDEM